MDDITAVRQAVDRMLVGELEPMLDLLAENVAFEVAIVGDTPIRLTDSGKESVLDYFSKLGGLVSFRQMDYSARGEHLIAWGKESFTLENCELEGGCEFALVFDVTDGLITRLVVVEDVPAFIRQPYPSTTFFSPSSIMPQFFSEWERASSLRLLSCVRETRVPFPSAESCMVTVW